MDSELSAASVSALVPRIERARAGELSLYGLLALVEDLEPASAELERSKQRREAGHTQLGAIGEAVLEHEDVLERAPAEAKRLLAEELRRVLPSGGAALTSRERTQTLTFVEKQLKAAAKDNSAAGEARRKMLRETRHELESCSPSSREQDKVRSLERQLASLKGEFDDIRKVYESWQAGKTKFKSNDQLQSTKRRYEALKKQVTDLQDRIEEAMHERRPASCSSNGASGSASVASMVAGKVRAAPSHASPASASAGGGGAATFAPAPRDGAASSSSSAPGTGSRGAAPRGAGGAAGAGGAWKRPGAKADQAGYLPMGFDDDEDPDLAFAAAAAAASGPARPARMAPKPKAARREAMKEAKARGRSILEELSADFATARGSVSSNVVGGQASRRPATGAGASGRSAGWSALAANGGYEEEEEDEEEDEEEQEEQEEAWEYGGGEQQPEEAPPDDPAAEVAAEGGGDVSALPLGWEAVWSEEHGANYYWNIKSDEVRWKPPQRPPPPPAKPAPSATAPRAKAAAARKSTPAAGDSQEPWKVAWPGGPTARRATEDQDPNEPKLSYLCVCHAIAVELQKSPEDIEDLGIPSVEEWRANFSAEEWARIRDRALQLEAAKAAKAKLQERKRTEKILAKTGPSQPGPKAKAAPASGAAARPSPAAGGSKSGGTSKVKAKPKAAAPKTGGLSSLATANRFSNFGGLMDSDSDDE